MSASDDERIWAMVCHLSCLFGGVFVPGLIYVIKGKKSPFIAFHARQALVYQGGVLVLMLLTLGLFMFLAPLFLLIGVVWAFKARNGERSPYPVVGRLFSEETVS